MAAATTASRITSVRPIHVQGSQPTADGVWGHDCRQEGRGQQLERVHILILELDVVSVPVCGVKIHLIRYKRGGNAVRPEELIKPSKYRGGA